MSYKSEQVILDLIDKKMNDFADRVLELAVQQLIDDGKIDTGTIIKTANINREYLHKEVTFPANYASIVNYGRSPNQKMPPPKELEIWVRRKLGVQGDKEIKRVSFAIAKAIGQRGIAGTFFVENAIQQARSEMQI